MFCLLLTFKIRIENRLKCCISSYRGFKKFVNNLNYFSNKNNCVSCYIIKLLPADVPGSSVKGCESSTELLDVLSKKCDSTTPNRGQLLQSKQIFVVLLIRL